MEGTLAAAPSRRGEAAVYAHRRWRLARSRCLPAARGERGSGLGGSKQSDWRRRPERHPAPARTRACPQAMAVAHWHQSAKTGKRSAQRRRPEARAGVTRMGRDGAQRWPGERRSFTRRE